MSDDRPAIRPEAEVTGSPLREIFVQALSRKSAEDRERYLAEACGGDHESCALVTSLLEAHAQAGGFLESPPTGLDLEYMVLGAVPLSEKPGDRIGRYKLLQQIGEGGCGVVYMAEQEEPVRRRVALKVIKLGMDTKSVIARFEAERQALAMMDHPNIAKVLDAGATDAGRPYFVMELVRGTKITEYCDQNSLATRERLDLFIKVCQAIQHAHQKGIIHRDIKPSNILVTVNDGVAVPKVIDFGIAKATEGRLTDKTLFTQFEALIGTPAYMSPEQAVMTSLDIDTRTDIYSLGVLLYELLVGKTPFDAEELIASGIDAMRKTIREKEPVRPSTKLTQELVAAEVSQRKATHGLTVPTQEEVSAGSRRRLRLKKQIALLRGDLDWIVMKCLEKDRARRYETANGLASDIQRHLNNEAVVARPPSAPYRFQKLIRRNKLAFAAVAAVICVLVLGAAVSTWQAVRATLAQREQSRLREVAEVAQKQEAQQRERAEAQELAARQRAYSSDMTLAEQAFAANNLGLAQELLSRQKPLPAQRDLRGWEWRYLWSRTQSDELFALRGHSNDVPIALFLHDGRTAFSGSSDHTLKFWNLETRSVVESIPYPDDPHRAALSPDGRFLAVGGSFGYWSLWDAPSRRLLMSRTNSTGVVGVTFSSTSLELAIADGRSIEIWGLSEQRLAKSFRRRNPGQGDRGFVVGLSFSPDNKKVAYAHADSRVVLHDLRSDEETAIGRVDGIAFSLAFSPDGRALVSADRSGITVWDATGQLPPRHLVGHREQVVCVVFSPNGKLLASASSDQMIKLWDAQSWEEIRTLKGHADEVHNIAFSHDGKSLISSGKDQTVRVWSVEKEPGPRDSLAVSDASNRNFGRPSGERLLRLTRLSSGGTVATFLDLETMKEGPPQTVPSGFRSARVKAIDRSFGLVAFALDEGSIEIWQTEPFARLKSVAPSEMPATAVALGETGNWLAVQRTNETTEIWDLRNGQLVRSLEAMPAPVKGDQYYKGLSFWAGDRRLVRATAAVRNIDACLEIITIPQWERRLIRSTHIGLAVMSNFVLSEDGTLLATAGYDGRVRLLDALTGREIEAFRGQLIGFIGLAFSPDGSRLAAGGMDGTITLWDVNTRQRVAHWKAHKHGLVVWLGFVQEGRAIASAEDDLPPSGVQAEIRLWRAPAWEEIEAAEAKEKTEIKHP